MNVPPRDRPDPRSRREREIERTDSESGTYWRSADEPGSYGCHERLGRVAPVATNLDGWVVTRPACLQDDARSVAAASALDTLWDLYHKIGDAHLDGEDRPSSGRDFQGNTR